MLDESPTRLVVPKDRRTMKSYQRIFEDICADERYRRNLDWGKPRKGHPEGTIRAHVADLERNLESLKDGLSEDEYWRCKILIHVHDTFKPDALRRVAIRNPRSHASLAAQFLSAHCNDEQLVAMAQLHDEPYALWQNLKSCGAVPKDRWDDLIDRISDWDLFIAFLIIDGSVPGKSRDSLVWFIHAVRQRIGTRLGVDDIP